MKTATAYYVYILECQNQHYYTGYTLNIERRFQEHLDGNAKCKYTRSFPPKRVAACWRIESCLSQALKIESGIKKLKRSDKVLLINDPLQLTTLLELEGIKLSTWQIM